MSKLAWWWAPRRAGWGVRDGATCWTRAGFGLTSTAGHHGLWAPTPTLSRRPAATWTLRRCCVGADAGELGAGTRRRHRHWRGLINNGPGQHRAARWAGLSGGRPRHQPRHFGSAHLWHLTGLVGVDERTLGPDGRLGSGLTQASLLAAEPRWAHAFNLFLEVLKLGAPWSTAWLVQLAPTGLDRYYEADRLFGLAGAPRSPSAPWPHGYNLRGRTAAQDGGVFWRCQTCAAGPRFGRNNAPCAGRHSPPFGSGGFFGFLRQPRLSELRADVPGGLHPCGWEKPG